MTVLSALFRIGDVEVAIGARRHRSVARWNRTGGDYFCAAVMARWEREEVPTVRDFTTPPALRLASSLASAAIVRDVAALGALILFGTMLALVLTSSGGPI